MCKKQFISVAAIAVVTGLGVSIGSAQITIPTVPIGNPGNPPDPQGMEYSGYGSVAYTYNIGIYEVTNAQYAAFLNAKAASDPFNLYHTNMAGSYGGIIRSGSAGSYAYSTVSGRENNPVNFVSFWDAIRFANWLHNGQGSGDTETGAYTLTPLGIEENTITRNAGWQWAVTSENEWYKAAYHQPASAGGDSDNYWRYPTKSNNLPWNMWANYGFAIGNTTPVGSYAAIPYAANYYGTCDMAGNLWEWNDTIILAPSLPSTIGPYRGVRGGWFNGHYEQLQSEARLADAPSMHRVNNGFRVVNNLPTLSTNLQLLNTVGSFAAARQITYSVIKNNVTIASGVTTANTSATIASLGLPPGQTGSATVVFDGSSFLRRVVAIDLTGSNQSLGGVTLTNGDADLSGEVDAADIDLVIADFGSTAVGNSDVDVSGEVDAADIDIVIASFGSVDE